MNTKAVFREFDLPSFGYPKPAPRAAQEPAFYNLHQRVLASKPSGAIVDLINGWYAAGHVANDNYTPAGWKADANKEALYQRVVARSCRTCHVAFGGGNSTELSWMTYAQFQPRRGSVSYDVCTGHTMPHAKITFENFWTATPSRADVLAGFTASDWAAIGTCK